MCLYMSCIKPLLTFTILYQFHWPWPCLRVTRSVQSKTSWLHFLRFSVTDEDEMWYAVIAIRVEHPDTAGLYSDAWKQISFKLGLMIDTTIWYQCEWPWPSQMVTWIWKRLNFCNQSVVKWHEVSQSLTVIDYVREMATKKSCKWDEYGSFEHFFFYWVVSCSIPLLTLTWVQ